MKNLKTARYLWLIILIFLAIPQMAFAGVYLESVSQSKGMPKGMPPNMPKQMLDQFNKTETIKQYITSNASRTETSTGIAIIDLNTRTMYQLSPNDKTYTKINIDTYMGGKNSKTVMAGFGEIKVTPTKKTKKIAGYMCKKYNVDIMGSTSEYWVSKDITGYKELMAFGKKMEKIFGKNPAAKQMAMLSKIDGYPIQMVSNIMGMTNTMTIKSIKKKSFSKDLFQVPKGYKLQELKFPPGMMRN